MRRQELAALPSREQILAKVLFLINASAQRLVTAVSGVGPVCCWDVAGGVLSAALRRAAAIATTTAFGRGYTGCKYHHIGRKCHP